MAHPVPEPRFPQIVRRSLAAIILIPVVLGAVILGGWVLVLLALGIGVLMVQEWSALCRAGLPADPDVRKARIGAGLALHAAVILPVLLALPRMGLAEAMPGQIGVVGPVAVTCLAIVAAGGLGAAFLFAGAPWRRRLLFGFGSPYIAIPLLSLLWLASHPEAGGPVVIWLLATVWLTDSGAYGAGKWFGGPRLAPAISPNKTWAGLCGGMMLSAAAALLYAVAAGLGSWASFIVLTIVVSGLSQLGDLFESAIKRRLGVKDSGTLIPGHGGLFDRLDGLLPVLPAVALLYLVGGGGMIPPLWGG